MIQSDLKGSEASIWCCHGVLRKPQQPAIGKSKWNKDKKRVEIVDIEYFNAKCVNPPEGIKSLEWIREGFKGADC